MVSSDLHTLLDLIDDAVSDLEEWSMYNEDEFSEEIAVLKSVTDIIRAKNKMVGVN
jgi:hypothetical protein